jgi:hypothetical protein
MYRFCASTFLVESQHFKIDMATYQYTNGDEQTAKDVDVLLIRLDRCDNEDEAASSLQYLLSIATEFPQLTATHEGFKVSIPSLHINPNLNGTFPGTVSEKFEAAFEDDSKEADKTWKRCQ